MKYHTIRSNLHYNANFEKRKLYFQQSTLIKILINYLQLLALVKYLGFKWHEGIYNLLQIDSYFTDFSENFSSFECYFGNKLNFS